MRSARVFFALLVLAGLHVAAALPARACSCTSFSDTEAFDRAGAVFVGELAAYTPPVPLLGTSAEPAIWTFEVSEVYKGEVAATQDVASPVPAAFGTPELPLPGARTAGVEATIFTILFIKRGARVGRSS